MNAIESDVAQINETGRRLVADCRTTEIEVREENQLAAIFTLEVDPTRGTLHYNCPVPPGVPSIGSFQIKVGPTEGHIMGTQYPNGRGRIVEFTPEQVSQFLFAATLFPKNAPRL